METKRRLASDRFFYMGYMGKPPYRGVLSDRILKALCDPGLEDPMIKPFYDKSIKVEENGKKVISYGLTSYGYDIRLANKFKIFDPIKCPLVDPKKVSDDNFTEQIVPEGEALRMPPHSYVLGYSLEHFNLYEDVVGIAVGKSTYARAGLIANVTPLEPGWRGHLTIEISNSSPVPALIYPNEGIIQIVFYMGDPCLVSYNDRGGKYQDQKNEVVLAKL